jgi:anaerobic dimethyl sulfoxide reductase subunit A
MDVKKEHEREDVIMTACSSHCAGTCVLRVHVKNGVVTAIETDNGLQPQFRACRIGRSMRKTLYNPERLMHPLRRVGERGEGKFEQISWDEALDAVAGELTRVKETYGPAAIILAFSGGDTSVFHASPPLMNRVLGQIGGYTAQWGFHSYEGGTYAQIASYGDVFACPTRDNFLHSRLIILWGVNQVNTTHHTDTIWHLMRAKESGAEIIGVDPRLTNTIAALSARWVPIRPCTDAAMLIAMAYVILKENLQDQSFLDRYTVGFEQFKRYVMGDEDGIAKTPGWASPITGVSTSTIEDLAKKYATIKPAALVDGIAPGRTAYGEQFHRAAIALAAMTGNIGILGGNSPGKAWGGSFGSYPYKLGKKMAAPPNPVEKGVPPRPYSLRLYDKFFPGGNSGARLSRLEVADAILKGKAGGYPTDYKLLYLINYNFLNQILNINKTIQALKRLEFIVTHEQFMTSTAKFADIIFPTSTRLERNDMNVGNSLPAFGYLKKVVEPLGESKSHFEICVELAKRLGISDSDFTDKTEEEWLKQTVEGSEIPDYEIFKEKGIYKIPLEGPFIPFKAQIEDPDHHPFPTPSGKIEIYSQELADMKSPKVPPVPKYIEPWEGPSDPLRKKYPFQLITTHCKRRIHSVYERNPWLRELDEPQAVTINCVDAEARGIRHGDMVRVFNDRGETILPAQVTQRIMPGVVEILEGGWYDPDENGVDRGGNPNVLTKDCLSPGGSLPTNTSLVEVAKA